jgi:hypothetical protein
MESIAMLATGRITGLDLHRRTVSDDLIHRLPDLAGIEAHHHHRIRAHRPRIADQTVQRMTARVLHQSGIFLDLAPDDRAQSRHEIARKPPAANDHAKDLTQRLRGAVTGNVFGGGDDHKDGSFPCLGGR